MKTADWQHFLQYCEPYVFHGILPGDYATTLAMLTGVFRKILDFKSTTRQSDDDAIAVTCALELECATALSAYEQLQVWPSVLMSGPVIHTPLPHLHLPLELSKELLVLLQREVLLVRYNTLYLGII